MKKVLSLLYTFARILPSNAFFNKVRGIIVGKLVNGECKNLKITRNVVFTNWENIKIGNNVIINPDSALIATKSKIEIGNDVLIAPRVYIQTQNHNFKIKDKLIRCQGETSNDIIIGNDIWIAYGVIILPAVKLITGCIIGAGSVVTSNLDKYSIYVGSPARKVGEEFEKIKILFVISNLPQGGAENQFIQLIRGIDKKKFEVSVVLYAYQKKLF